MNYLSFPANTRSRAAVVTLAAICLAGCSPHKAPAAQPQAPARPATSLAAPIHTEPAIKAPGIDKTRTTELMQEIFGIDYHADDGAALVNIEEGEDAGYWRMTLCSARELPDGRMAVVVNGAPSDENGADLAAHVSPGMLGVYTLRRTDGAWQVVERHQDAGMMGSSGTIGDVEWITLGTGKPGIVIYSGGTWFGNTIANAAIFDLDQGMRSLGGFAGFSSNAGACMPETTDCWDVEGKIGTVAAGREGDYRDIVVDFEGKHFRVTEDANGKRVKHTTRTVHQTARYHFNGKTYVLVSGKNPVPSIEG